MAEYGDVTPEAMGRRLRAIRLAAGGMNQSRFGELVGAKKPSVQAWENGRAIARPTHLRAICEHFEVTTDFILLGDWRTLQAGRWAEIRDARAQGA